MLLSATLQAAAADKITKTETYEFCYYSDDGLASNDQDEPCWIGQNGYHFWSDQASAVGARCNAYDNVYILSKVTFPSVVKKVIITAGAWSDVSTSLSVNGSAKSLYTINSSQYRGNESNISFSDYEFNDVSTSGYDGKLRIDYVLGGQADIFIRSITVQYEVDPDPETYAVLSDDNTVLTFYYDNEKGDKEGALSVVPFNNLEMQSWYSSRENITSVVFNSSFANCDTLTSTAYWFYGCKNLTSITGIENLKTDIVTKMNNMFSDCYSLTSLDVSNFNTENVTNMSAMFSGCSGLSVLDLSKFNTANVKDMTGMFDGCSGLTTIYVGYYWSTVNVENSYDMFDGCTAIFGEADTRYDSNNTDATYAHIDGGTENPGYLTDTKEPYAILSENNTVLTFYYDNQKDLKNGMSVGPFANSTSRPWNGKSSNIKTVVFDESFANCASIESTAYWFCNFMNLTVVTNLEYLNTTNVTNMNSMFDTCFKVESLDVSNFDTRNVTDMGKTFYLCMNLKSLDVSKFDTRNVTDMSSMFAGNQSLTSLDISNFNTQNVTSMLGMFSGCSSLTSLDVSLFNVDKVTSFEGMFRSCSNLTAIYCDNTWIKDYVDSNGMFLQCTSLSNYDSSRDSNNYPIEYARPVAYGGYFTPTSEKENPNVISEPYAVLSEENTILTFYYDDQKDTRGGMSVGPFNKGEDSGWFNLNSTITTVVFDDSFAKCTSLTSTAYWFYMCQKLTNIMGVENLKTNKVTDMSWMFSNCNVLNSVDVSGFSTYNVTNMSNMFLGCYALTNLNVSNFNTTNVTDMSGMFEECRSLATLDVSNFNTSKVTTMSYMFDHCESLTVLDLCNFNTSKLSDVSHMFSDSKNLTTIYVENDWSHDGVSLNGTSMFEGAVSLVGGAGTAYNMYRIDYFYARIDEGTDNPGYFSKYAEAYAVLTDNEDNATKTLTFYYDNQKAERTNPLSIGPFSYVASWDSNKDKITAVVFDESFDNYKKLTSTYYWFSYCKNLATITGIEYLHTDNVTNMGQMFNQCESLTSLDVSHFNTEKVTNMNLMFCSCSKLTVLDVSGFNTANVNYMGSMFSGCSSVATLDVSHFNTERVIRMGGMFSGCSSLTSLDVSNFNTGQVIDMGSAFRGLKNLTTLDVSNLNTSNVTNMYFMFADNSNLTSLDLSNFNTAKVTRMGYMFNGCSKVETITVGQDWTTANIGDNSLDTNGTFGSCNALVGGAGTVYDSNHTDVSYAHIDGGETNPGYLSGDLPEPYALLSESNTVLTFYYDEHKEDRSGMSVGPFSYPESQSWYNVRESITSVVFDSSFANCTSITSTAYWFYDCKNLTNITGIENLNTANVTNMGYMFCVCPGLTSLDVSKFNTEKVTNMEGMFASNPDLTTIYVGDGWTVASVTSGEGVFNGCTSLVGGMGTTYDADHVDAEYAHIDGGTSNPGYLTDINAPDEAYAVLSSDGLTVTFYYDTQKGIRGGININTEFLSTYNGESSPYGSATTAVIDISFANYRPTSTYSWFILCSSLTNIIGIENIKTDNVTNMSYMFSGCRSLTSLDVTGFNTENVKTLLAMFEDCSSLKNLDVTGFNTASVTRMDNMFSGCRSLTSLDVTGFNTENVTSMNDMFMNCSGLTSIDLSNFNTANVTSMAYMFRGCSGLTSLDISTFNSQNVINMNDMFYGCSSLTSLDLSTFNTDNLVYMGATFGACSALTTLDLSSFNTTNVSSMRYMLYGCAALTTLDLSNFNTTSVTDMGSMFYGCSALTTIYVGEGWNIDNLTESADVFKGCTAIAGGAGTTYDADHTDYTYAHIDGGPLNPGYLTEKKYAYASLNEDNTVLTFYYDGHKMDRGGMSVGPFSEYSEKGWYDQKGTITKVVFDDSFAQYTELTSTFTWFDLCSNLATVEGLSNLNTENVLNMRSMFEACSSLTSLDLSNFNTAKVKDFGLMFAGCTNLTTIYVGEGWSTEGVTEESTYMFADCTSLVGGASTSYDDEHKDATYARIDGGEDNPGYLTGKILEPYAVLKDNDDEVIVDEVTVNGKTLTFYYDGQKTGRNGMSVGPFNDSNNQSWSNARESITSVVFDASFANCTTLTSTTLWFSGLENLNSIIGIENLNTANVSDMRSMFYGCSSLTSLDVSNFNTANVTNMACMFYDCSKLTNLDVSKFNTANVTNMTGMFMRCFGLTNLDVSNFKTANVTDMSTMFCYCPNLTSLDVSNFNTTNVTDMYAMFNGCSSLTSLDVSNFSTVNVTRMNYMFYGCTGLTTIDVSNFNTAKVKLMNYMFKDCSELTTIYVGSGWSTASVTDGENLFTGCVKLVGGDGTEYSADHVDASYAHVDGGEDNPGYLTDKYGVVITVKECTREYGATNPKFEYTTKGAAISGKPTISCGATATSPVGTYPITVSYTKAEGESMLNITCVNGSMTITKAPLTITAKSYTIKRGEEMPTLEATYTGLKNRETDTVFTKKPVISTVAKPDTLPGTYPIVASGAEAKNYEMSYVDGTLTITDDVTVTANSYTRVYGDDNPTFEFTSEGATLSGTPAITCSATATSPVGTYDIVIAKGDITNSTVTCVNGTLTITKAPLTITAKSYTIKQGRALPTLEAEYSGFKNNETDTVFTKKPIVSTNATSDSEPGTYDITVSGAEATNYEMTYVNGILTITKKTESFDGIVLVVEENGNIDDAFESCGGKAEVAKTIAAVVWNDSTELKAEMLDGISNPNLLIYVGDEKLAPSGFNNVVINGVAKNIKLTDGGTGNYNFYVPQEFKADSISYSREFKQATRDSVSRGWEGIALPFTVQTFTHEEHGNISPFGNDACDYHFWLRQPTENGVVSAKTIEANKPYIISMPNSDEYEPEFNHPGLLKFTSTNVTVPVTKVESVWLGDSAQIVPTFQNIEASPDIYVLNVGDSIMDQTEGSIFISNYRSARPFEVYTFHEPRGNETNIFGSRIISLSSLFGGNGTTGVNDAMKTAEPNGETWYDMNGRRLQGKPTHKGVYIMNGKKVVIK